MKGVRIALRVFIVGLLYLLVLLPNLSLLGMYSSPLSFSPRLSAFFGGLAGLMLVAAFQKSLPRVTAAVLGLLALLAILETQFLLKFGSFIDANAISLLAETNPAEEGDLLSSIPLNLLAALSVVIIVAIAGVRFPFIPKVWLRGWLLFAGTAILATLLLTTIDIPVSATQKELAIDQRFPQPASEQQRALRSAFPSGVPAVLLDYLDQRRALIAAFEHNRNFRFGATRLDHDDRRKVFVLVIGETSRADHWAINGYKRDTTPLLNKRADVIPFGNMYSFSTFSRIAVPLLISRKPPESADDVFAEASLVTAFKEAGFHTAWISLQAPVGFHESPISVHAYEAQDVIFLNPVDYRNHGKLDSAALPELQRLIAATHDDLFVVIHTLGSHYRYVDRYPAESARFLPDRYPDRKESLYEPSDKEVLTNAYDNTILATDALLDEIIALLSSTSADSWMFFSSDHGEALFDDCRMQSGHGQSSRATHWVAALFWVSESFSKSHHVMVENIKSNAKRLASTSMVFDTLTRLGDLAVPGARSQLDLAGPKVSPPKEITDLHMDVAPSCAVQGRTQTE